MLSAAFALNVFHNFVLAVCLVISMPFFHIISEIPVYRFTDYLLMYIYNITFAIEGSRLDSLLDWIRTYAAPALDGDGASSPRLATVEDMPEGTDLHTVALQYEFGSLADFEHWQNVRFENVMRDYTVAFAPEALYFATLLRTISLT